MIYFPQTIKVERLGQETVVVFTRAVFKTELIIGALILTALDLKFALRVPLMLVTGGGCPPSWPWVSSSVFEESIDDCKFNISFLLFKSLRFSRARKRSSDLCCFSNFSCSHLFLTAKAFLNSLEKFWRRSSFFGCIVVIVRVFVEFTVSYNLFQRLQG